MTDHNPYSPDAVEVVETRDGSKTLYDPVKQVHYRSIWGADSESRHLFLEGTRLIERPPPWRVLELGFGAGVNFARTVEALLSRGRGTLAYHSVEYAPVEPDRLEFHDGEIGRLARRALQAVAETGEPVDVLGFEGRVRLYLYPINWLDFERPALEAQALYYDPFGPQTEPQSWSQGCFEHARRHMAEDAILATYSAATDVKRAMFAAGFSVASAPGPGKKREVTFASPRREPLAQRDDVALLDPQRYADGTEHDQPGDHD